MNEPANERLRVFASTVILGMHPLVGACERPPLVERDSSPSVESRPAAVSMLEAAVEECVEPVAAGAEWFQKHDESCPGGTNQPGPYDGTAQWKSDGPGCAMLKALTCGANRDLDAPALWRVRRALAASPRLGCKLGPAGSAFELRSQKTDDGRVQFDERCPSSAHPAFPHAPPMDGEHAIASVLALIHGASKTSEYDYIEDAYRHLPDGDDRGEGVAMVVGFSALRASQGGCTDIDVREVGSIAQSHSEVMCEGGPFEGDRRFEGEQCTAFFVGPRYLVTAGHCVTHGGCNGVPKDCTKLDEAVYLEKRQILRHFARRAETETLAAAGVMPGTNAKLVACSTTKAEGLHGADWAVFRLDTAVPGKGLELSDAPPVSGSLVHMLSHIANLPLKHSAEGAVRNVGGGKFEMEVDGYTGSSGAPVFDDEKRVVGIYVNQETPALETCKSGGCKVFPICPAKHCHKLPRATRMDEVRETIAHDEACLATGY